MPPPLTLATIVARLRRQHGAPSGPVSDDPFAIILWEQVAYLAPDARRRLAHATLAREVGLTAGAVAEAPLATLQRVARVGGAIAVKERAARMRHSAVRVLQLPDGDLLRALRSAWRESPAKARRLLAAFPMIGAPGTDKILVTVGVARALPLDSNGLRVLQRLGISPTDASYARAYQAAQQAVAHMLPSRREGLVEAFALLQQHGQTICRRGEPRCDECALRSACRWAKAKAGT